MSEGLNVYHCVDSYNDAALLLEGMRQTAAWPAVQELRKWTRPSLEVLAGGVVLDVGCGLGEVLIDLARTRSEPIRLVGIDASELMLDAARADAAAAGVTIDLRRGDAAALPFPDASFDAVRCERTLQWVNRPSDALHEILRVLRPGGSVVLIDTDWRTFALDVGDREVEELLSRLMVIRSGADVGGRLRGMALDAGFEDVSVRGATAVVTDWSPDSREGPAGWIRAHMVAQLLTEAFDMTESETAASSDALVEAARRGRFQMTLSLMAVTARRARPYD